MDFKYINDKNVLKMLMNILLNRKFRSTTSIAVAMFFLLNCGGSSKYEKEEVIYNEVNVEEFLEQINSYYSFFNNVAIPFEVDKFAVVMDEYGLTTEELDIVLAGCVAESCGDGTNYDDAYSVASTIYNRYRSYKWVSYISSVKGKDLGKSIYNQFTAPSQFSVYASGSYKKYLGRSDLIGYQAALDMFYSKEPNHKYLSFRSNDTNLSCKYELFDENGNKYFNELTREDTMEDSLVLNRTK